MKSPVCDLPFVTVPTPILDPERVQVNIQRMADKARRANIIFRPHFKTHQSMEIGRWFREAGVDRIAVSSIRMAAEFAQDGWKDILVAFPVNIRELDHIRTLARTCRLQLLVDNPAVMAVLNRDVSVPLGIWIKVDTGYGRSGIPWQRTGEIEELVQQINRTSNRAFRGLLTHAGHAYKTSGADQIRAIFEETRQRLNQVKNTLAEQNIPVPAVSVGDTPGCSLAVEFDGLDEIRPGNFVFYDLMQMELESCGETDLALALACPVVGIYPERGEVIIMGGAVHFSKEMLPTRNDPMFGMGIHISEGRFGRIMPAIRITGLSQEHGTVSMPANLLNQLRIGDVLAFVPAHSCLTADLYDHYRTIDGKRIDRINSVTLRS